MTFARLLPFAALTVGASVALGACAGSSATESARNDLEITAGFYPVAFVAERVAGTHGTVTLLAAAGAEPHDLELSPSAVRQLGDADVVLLLGGFQPAVDDAVAVTGAHAFDAETVVDAHDDAAHSDEHSDEASAAAPVDDGHGHEGGDPHFWLNPELLGDYADALATEFGALDPAHADGYRRRADALIVELTELDGAYTAGLARCEHTTVVVPHEAFGFMAERYGFEQMGIAGLNPDAEPSPMRVREVRESIVASGSTTLFVERLPASPLVRSLAGDTHTVVGVLNPVETLTDPNDTYLIIMTRNLEALEAGLGCS